MMARDVAEQIWPLVLPGFRVYGLGFSSWIMARDVAEQIGRWSCQALATLLVEENSRIFSRKNKSSANCKIWPVVLPDTRKRDCFFLSTDACVGGAKQEQNNEVGTKQRGRHLAGAHASVPL